MKTLWLAALLAVLLGTSAWSVARFNTAYAQSSKIEMPKNSELKDSLGSSKWNVQTYKDEENFENYIVVNGTPIYKESLSSSLFFGRKVVTRQNNADVFLIAENSGGAACPVTYRFLTIYDDGKTKLSDSFGTCSDLAQVSVYPPDDWNKPDILEVILPDERMKSHRYRWDNGNVMEIKK